MFDLQPASSASARAIRIAWLMVALLWPVALLNYLDRQMIAAMKTSVMHDVGGFHGDRDWGFMLGLFKWVYAFLSPLGGFIADRYSRRATICASLFVWSAVTLATGQVTTFNGLLWTRALMGVSEAFYIPGALSLIADHHSRGTRSRAIGLHLTGIYFGIILGGFSGYVADAPDWGWRSAFNITGLVGMLYAVPLMLLLRDPPKVDGVDETRDWTKPSPATAARELLTNRSFIFLVLCFTLPALAGWVVKDWMPVILKDRFHIGQGKAGVSATLYVNVAALIGAFLGGWWADRWMRRTRRGRIYVSATGMCLLIPALFGVGNSWTLLVAILFLVVFGIGWGFFDANNMPILSQIVRPEVRATGYGIMNLVSISSGGFADWGFGTLRDANVPLNVIFGAFAATAMISVVLVLLIQPTQHTEIIE